MQRRQRLLRRQRRYFYDLGIALNGGYETISLDEKKGTMVVRYHDSGEESELSISIQARIWRNMDWDDQVPHELGYELGSRANFGREEDYDYSSSTPIRHAYCHGCGTYLNSRKNPHCPKCRGLICFDCRECFCR